MKLEEEQEQEIANQVFPSHETLNDRFCKTLYYGRLPSTDRTSLPLTQLAVDRFTGVGLDALGERLGRLDVGRAADISRTACASPTSLVLALLYLDRLRRNNPDYLNTISSTDLFLVSLLVANKFLHDDGEEDEVFNDEWASSGGIDTKELNRLELSFLSAMDWRIYVANKEFVGAVSKVESDIAFREVSARGWATYTDLHQLANTATLHRVWSLLTDCSLKATAVCLTAYAASILTLLGTVSVLSHTPVGPAQVASSVRTLASSVRGFTARPATDPSPDSLPDTLTDPESLLDSRPSAAEFLTASLLVVTLTSGSAEDDSGQRREGRRRQADGRNKSGDVEEEKDDNYQQARWLAEISSMDDSEVAADNMTKWDKRLPDLRAARRPPDPRHQEDHARVDSGWLYESNESARGDGGSNESVRAPWLRWEEEFIRHSTTADITSHNWEAHNYNYAAHPNLAYRNQMGGLTDGILESLVKHWTDAVKEDLGLVRKEGRKIEWGYHCPVLKWGAQLLVETKTLVTVTS